MHSELSLFLERPISDLLRILAISLNPEIILEFEADLFVSKMLKNSSLKNRLICDPSLLKQLLFSMVDN